MGEYGQQVSYIAAFGAGILSFLSPCVVPMIPFYIAYLAGTSADKIAAQAGSAAAADAEARRRVVVNALAFVTGFSLVFVALGASLSLLGQMAVNARPAIRIVGGAAAIVMGLHTMGALRIGFLMREHRAMHTLPETTNILGSLAVGMAFGAGWTPCVGPILATILAYAAGSETYAQGVTMLVVYSLGLAVPFLAAAAFVGTATRALGRLKRHLGAIQKASGIFLVALGIMLFGNYLEVLSIWFQGLLYSLGIG